MRPDAAGLVFPDVTHDTEVSTGTSLQSVPFSFLRIVPSAIASTAAVIVVEPFATYRYMNVSFGANFGKAKLSLQPPYLSCGHHASTAQHLAITSIVQQLLRPRKVQAFVVSSCVPSRGEHLHSLQGIKLA
jgi:hypothetical protein